MMIETPSGSLETGPDMRVGSTEPVCPRSEALCDECDGVLWGRGLVAMISGVFGLNFDLNNWRERERRENGSWALRKA